MTAFPAPRTIMAMLALFGVAGCVTDTKVPPPDLAQLGIADHYSTAGVERAETLAAALSAPAIAAEQPAQWWTAFGDPVLDALIERANADNLDVQEAMLDDGRRAARTAIPPTLEMVRGKVQAAVARIYIGLRGRQVLIADNREFLVQRQALIQLAQFRAQAGLVPALDTARAVASRDEIVARIADLEAQDMQDIGQIAMLTGQAPEALGELVADTAQVPVGPGDVALGSRSALLLRRADIKAAADRLAASGPQAGVQGSALIDYKRAVLRAVQEVEAQNSAFQHAKLREIDLGRAVATAEAAALLARKAYADGQADYSTLDQVETRLLSGRAALRQAQVQRATALIGLYMALGTDTGGGAIVDNSRGTSGG